MNNYFKKLSEVLLDTTEVEVRPSREFTEDGFTLVVYKNRNTDKNILDRIVGAENWQKGHEGRANLCYIEIWDPEKAQWIHKEDFGGLQNLNVRDNEKAVATDAMKRAGENWGIGRELYTAPRIFIRTPMVNANASEYNSKVKWELPAETAAKYSNENIEVRELASEIINGAKTLTKIVLAFRSTGDVFFEWEKDAEGTGKVKKTRKKAEPATASASEPEVKKEVEAPEANEPETDAEASEDAEVNAPAEAEVMQENDPIASYTGDPLDAPLTLLPDYASDGSLAPYIGKPLRDVPESYLGFVLKKNVEWRNFMGEPMYRLIEKAVQG